MSKKENNLEYLCGYNTSIDFIYSAMYDAMNYLTQYDYLKDDDEDSYYDLNDDECLGSICGMIKYAYDQNNLQIDKVSFAFFYNFCFWTCYENLLKKFNSTSNFYKFFVGDKCASFQFRKGYNYDWESHFIMRFS